MRVDSWNNSIHPTFANVATRTSALAPKLGRVGPDILFSGICVLTPSRGQPLRVPKESGTLHPSLPCSP